MDDWLKKENGEIQVIAVKDGETVCELGFPANTNSGEAVRKVASEAGFSSVTVEDADGEVVPPADRSSPLSELETPLTVYPKAQGA